MNFFIKKISIMKFFAIFLIFIAVSFFLLPYANAAQLDSFIELQESKSQFTAKYHAIVLIEHNEESQINEILKDRDWTISKTVNANDSDSIALATKLNQKISDDGSNVKISDLSVEYQTTLQSENNQTTINYSITLFGTLSNYVLDSDDLLDLIFVDVNWRGLSVDEPVFIEDYDINSPLSAIIEKEPEVYYLIESHQKVIDMLSENIIDAENILQTPFSKWYFGYGPLSLSGEVLGDTVSEFSFDPMLEEDYPEDYIVTETFTIDGDDDYVVEIMRLVDSASISMEGFATVNALDDTEILEISRLPVDIPQIPENKVVSGKYTNEEFGFSVSFPDNLEGFLTEIENQDTGKIVIIQIHPQMGPDEICCPSVDTSSIVMLLENHPKNMLATPVPVTGDLYAAIQGYRMNMSLDALGDLPVLTATLEHEREYREFPEPVKRVGKFYYVDAGDRYLSYGLLATDENYKKYINEFEESAKSLILANAKPVNLNEVFDYPRQMQLTLKDESVINSRVITPSNIGSVTLDQKSNSLHIMIDEPNSYRSFLLTNIGEVLEEPYVVMFDDIPVDGQILENESGKYMMIYYENKRGPHEISITGSKIVPEFGTIVVMILVVAIMSVIAISARSRLSIIPRI